MYHQRMCEFLNLVPKVQKISKTLFGLEKFDVSSLTAPYSHFDCSRIYSSASAESSHIDWASYTRDEGFFNEHKEQEIKVKEEMKDKYASKTKDTGKSKDLKRPLESLELVELTCSPIKKIKTES